MLLDNVDVNKCMCGKCGLSVFEELCELWFLWIEDWDDFYLFIIDDKLIWFVCEMGVKLFINDINFVKVVKLYGFDIFSIYEVVVVLCF